MIIEITGISYDWNVRLKPKMVRTIWCINIDRFGLYRWDNWQNKNNTKTTASPPHVAPLVKLATINMLMICMPNGHQGRCAAPRKIEQSKRDPYHKGGMCNGGAFSEHLSKRMLPSDRKGRGQPAKITFDGDLRWRSGGECAFIVVRCVPSINTYAYICVYNLYYTRRIQRYKIRRRRVDRMENAKKEREKKHGEVLVVWLAAPINKTSIVIDERRLRYKCLSHHTRIRVCARVYFVCVRQRVGILSLDSTSTTPYLHINPPLPQPSSLAIGSPRFNGEQNTRDQHTCTHVNDRHDDGWRDEALARSFCRFYISFYLVRMDRLTFCYPPPPSQR